MNKINLLFDCTLFNRSFFNSNSGRSGVFFVAWNVLQPMCKKGDLQIMLAYPSEYAGTKNLQKLRDNPFFSQFKFVCVGAGFIHEDNLLLSIDRHKKNRKYIRMCYSYFRLVKSKIKEMLFYRKKCLKEAHFYLSPYYPIPRKIFKQKHIKKIYILYDVTPLLPQNFFKEHYANQNPYMLLIETFDKNIYSFCISQSCKDDYLKYCGDNLDANKLFVTYIATNQNYTTNHNKQELIQVLKKYNVEHNQNDKYLFSLCSLEPRKNLPFTIACFLKFVKKHGIDDLYFYLGGSAWETFESTMAKTLEEAGDLKTKIKLLGYYR